MRKMHQTSTPGLHNSSQFLISKAVLSADTTTIWDLYLRISLIQSLNCRSVYFLPYSENCRAHVQSLNCRTDYFLPYSENLTLFTDIISKPNSVWMDVPALLDLAGLNIENIMESDWRFFYKHMMGTSVVRQSKNMLLISLPTNGGFVIKKIRR